MPESFMPLVAQLTYCALYAQSNTLMIWARDCLARRVLVSDPSDILRRSTVGSSLDWHSCCLHSLT